MTPSTPQATTSNVPKEGSTKQPTERNSVPKAVQNRKSSPEIVVTGPQQITNAWTKPLVPSMKEFLVATSANRTNGHFQHHKPINTNQAGSHKHNTTILKEVLLESAALLGIG